MPSIRRSRRIASHGEAPPAQAAAIACNIHATQEISTPPPHATQSGGKLHQATASIIRATKNIHTTVVSLFSDKKDSRKTTTKSKGKRKDAAPAPESDLPVEKEDASRQAPPTEESRPPPLERQPSVGSSLVVNIGHGSEADANVNPRHSRRARARARAPSPPENPPQIPAFLLNTDTSTGERVKPHAGTSRQREGSTIKRERQASARLAPYPDPDLVEAPRRNARRQVRAPQPLLRHNAGFLHPPATTEFTPVMPARYLEEQRVAIARLTPPHDFPDTETERWRRLGRRVKREPAGFYFPGESSGGFSREVPQAYALKLQEERARRHEEMEKEEEKEEMERWRRSMMTDQEKQEERKRKKEERKKKREAKAQEQRELIERVEREEREEREREEREREERENAERKAAKKRKEKKDRKRERKEKETEQEPEKEEKRAKKEKTKKRKLESDDSSPKDSSSPTKKVKREESAADVSRPIAPLRTTTKRSAKNKDASNQN